MEANFSLKLIGFLTAFTSWQAYGVIIGVLLACGLGVPIPEDITLLAAGVLSAMGTISFTGAMIAGFFGVLAGDSFLFFLGRKFGHHVFTLPGFRKIFTEELIRKAEHRVASNSKFICFTARFLPGLRAPIFLTAGILGVRPIIFFALDGFAALISVPVWIYLGWYFGKNLDVAIEYAKRLQLYLFLAVFLIIIGYIGWKRHQNKSNTAHNPEN